MSRRLKISLLAGTLLLIAVKFLFDAKEGYAASEKNIAFCASTSAGETQHQVDEKIAQQKMRHTREWREKDGSGVYRYAVWQRIEFLVWDNLSLMQNFCIIEFQHDKVRKTWME